MIGSAVVRALLARGYAVTVWNRTDTSIDPLVELGAQPATSVAEAVAKARVVLVALSGYDVARDVLAPLDLDLDKQIYVEFATGSAEQAAEMEALLTSKGARYLDLVVHYNATQMGTDGQLLLVGGDEATFADAGEILRALGNVRYLGAQVGVANSLDQASLTLFYAVATGFSLAVAAAEKAGLSAQDVLGFVQEMKRADRTLEMVSQAVADPNYAQPGSPIRVHLAGLDSIIQSCRASGLDPWFAEGVRAAMQSRLPIGDPEGIKALYTSLTA